jgi:hypothetical protein
MAKISPITCKRTNHRQSRTRRWKWNSLKRIFGGITCSLVDCSVCPGSCLDNSGTHYQFRNNDIVVLSFNAKYCDIIESDSLHQGNLTCLTVKWTQLEGHRGPLCQLPKICFQNSGPLLLPNVQATGTPNCRYIIVPIVLRCHRPYQQRHSR